MILAIDPSFTRTGLALLDGGCPLILENIKADSSVYESILTLHEGCFKLASEIERVLDGLEGVDVIVEYPAFQTRSGAYLAVLNGVLAKVLRENRAVKTITWVGPKHCDSFIKNKDNSKSYIVEYCKRNSWIPQGQRISHDICTAVVLAHLLMEIQKGSWKNSYFTTYGIGSKI